MPLKQRDSQTETTPDVQPLTAKKAIIFALEGRHDEAKEILLKGSSVSNRSPNVDREGPKPLNSHTRNLTEAVQQFLLALDKHHFSTGNTPNLIILKNSSGKNVKTIDLKQVDFSQVQFTEKSWGEWQSFIEREKGMYKPEADRSGHNTFFIKAKEVRNAASSKELINQFKEKKKELQGEEDSRYEKMKIQLDLKLKKFEETGIQALQAQRIAIAEDSSERERKEADEINKKLFELYNKPISSQLISEIAVLQKNLAAKNILDEESPVTPAMLLALNLYTTGNDHISDFYVQMNRLQRALSTQGALQSGVTCEFHEHPYTDIQMSQAKNSIGLYSYDHLRSVHYKGRVDGVLVFGTLSPVSDDEKKQLQILHKELTAKLSAVHTIINKEYPGLLSKLTEIPKTEISNRIEKHIIGLTDILDKWSEGAREEKENLSRQRKLLVEYLQTTVEVDVKKFSALEKQFNLQKATENAFSELVVNMAMVNAAMNQIPQEYIRETTLSRLDVGNDAEYWQSHLTSMKKSSNEGSPHSPKGMTSTTFGPVDSSFSDLDKKGDILSFITKGREIVGFSALSAWGNEKEALQIQQNYHVDLYVTDERGVKYVIMSPTGGLGPEELSTDSQKYEKNEHSVAQKAQERILLNCSVAINAFNEFMVKRVDIFTNNDSPGLQGWEEGRQDKNMP